MASTDLDATDVRAAMAAMGDVDPDLARYLKAQALLHRGRLVADDIAALALDPDNAGELRSAELWDELLVISDELAQLGVVPRGSLWFSQF
jgi:hypothetical protein